MVNNLTKPTTQQMCDMITLILRSTKRKMSMFEIISYAQNNLGLEGSYWNMGQRKAVAHPFIKIMSKMTDKKDPHYDMRIKQSKAMVHTASGLKDSPMRKGNVYQFKEDIIDTKKFVVVDGKVFVRRNKK